MAGVHSYPLLVELEETKIPRLKIKLVKYFQSKKSNGGGECEVEYENGSSTAMVRFRREEDQRNVLAKESHQISLEKGILKLTVRLPTEEKSSRETPSDKDKKKSDVAADKQASADKSNPTVQTETEGGDDDTADEEPCSTSAVLGNILDNTNQEFLEMLVENITKSHDFTLEFFPDISSAVVTFQSGEENANFVAKCPQNKMFTKKGFSVQPLEVTKQVLVDDILHFSEEVLQLYFENEGGDVEEVFLNEAEQSAVITFKDHRAVQKIFKKKHSIKKEEIRVYPFYKSLGVALYGKDKPALKLPAAISEPIDSAVLRYLAQNTSAAEAICSEMEKHFCIVNLGQTTVTLSPVSSLLKQKNAKAILKVWTDTVKSAFAQSVSKFKSVKFCPDSDALKESEKKIREMLLNENVIVVPDKDRGALSVAGPVSDVNRLEKSLSEIINKIAKTIHRDKSSKTEEIKVSPSVFHLLCQDGLMDNLLLVYPEVKLSPESPNLKITGLGEEINAASKVIFDAVLALKRQNLEVDKYVLELLKDEQQEELTGALFTSHRINAAFEISGNRVQLLAVSDTDLSHAQDHLGQMLTTQYINVEDSNVLKKPEWQQLVSHLEQANSKPCRTRINTTAQQVVVSGYKDSAIKVQHRLGDFLTQNAHIEETVVVKANAVVKYLEEFNTSWMEKVKDKVRVSYRNEAICLSGSRVNVTHCKTVVEGAVSAVVFDSLNVYKSGVKKLFQENEAYFSTIKTKTGCLVQLVNKPGGGQDNVKQVPTPLYQLKMPGGVEIAVYKADMCTYPVQAVVSPFNQDLKHSTGLAAALLKAAGPQLQDEFYKMKKTKGQLKPGDCVITDAGGTLCCQKVIHAVAPKYEKPQQASAQLNKVVKGSLEFAEAHGCVSVALPSIGRGMRCFPLKQCELTIVKAVKEYCYENYDDITLQKIHFVNNDDIAVQDMVAAVRQEFGNLSDSHFQQTPHLTAPTQSVSQSTGSDLCLNRVQTKEGVDIVLTKGNLEASTTEVIVNTVSSDLDLNRGAVSQAILRAAGPKLQQLVDAQGATGNVGEIIITDGCQLKSKKVFHAVAPHYKDQATSEKTLRGIFKDCLNMAEDNNLTSISLSAIGAGNLGFPKDLVASLLLDKILEFSKKKHPKHLKKVVIVLYPSDTQTIQAFSDEFQKKFPSASSGSPSSTQRGPFSKITSTSDMHETKMGNVTIQVVTGDITKETADVIVNSSNENFTLKSGVSKAILEAAGPAVEVECRNLGAEPNPGMVLTSPGNLKCKKILHLAGQTDPVKINKTVKDALQLCVKSSFTSVSFPAIGTGQGNAQARLVADAMLDAVTDVLSQNTASPLTTVRIVIFQKPMLKDFHSSMQQREAADPDSKDKGGWTWGWSKFKSIFTGGSADKPKNDKDFVIDSLKVEATCFHICGDTQTSVDSAKKWINDKISQEYHSMEIGDNAILCFSDADRQKIVDMQKTMDISIRTESNKPKATITIEGLSRDVLKANTEIIKMMSRVRDEEELNRKVELASAAADWQYQQSGFQFQSFDEMTNFHLEEALQQNLQTVKVTVKGQDYTVTMPKGPATDSQGNILEIKRIDKLKGDVPENWEQMKPNATNQAFPLQAGTQEYDEIQKLFQASCKQTIIKIERIQNPTLWSGLQVKKRDMEVRNGHQNNERRLFHGTSEDTVATINDRGFNRSFAGKNAACYGNGTYFAVNASYSASNTYSKPNQNGEKFMYVCRVLTGDFALGQQGMIVPPAKGTSTISTDLYDSVVDNMANPSMFVVFHDIQAYPEYLIKFK
ncbi:poly(ADP-ribose) polymerase family member 14-related sequence 1 isoform X3 [Astatotilapia calliptera]|uniref:poly(ADP-ribose) polymerase family member 14-related sequence 1 isoform X3 n=1 Tax=Astatotilapia calliptera TaxID=8154 RepID=UPI000E42CB35|nr:poly [ADP-ribose] polymerase 14-like isoform X3 [Astatotilapia calliptera]